jgi:hypothetical protein
MQRVLRYDGLLPAKMPAKKRKFLDVTPRDIRQMKAYIDANRTATTPFDIVVEGKTPGNDPHKDAVAVLPWIEAGATWWLEGMWDDHQADHILARIRQGPPKVTD